MRGFTKDKIMFAVALLAVLFTVSPLIKKLEGVGFPLFDYDLRIEYVYYVMAAALGLSVYCFGAQFLTVRDMRPFTVAGDALYAIAMVTPALYLGLFLAVQLSGLARVGAPSRTVDTVLQALLSVVMALVSTILARYVMELLAKRGRESEVQEIEQEEDQFLARARELEQAGHYDLAVVEAFRAIEYAGKKLGILSHNARRSSMSQVADRLPDELRTMYRRLRDARNMTVHAVEPITAERAGESLATANRVVAYLRHV